MHGSDFDVEARERVDVVESIFPPEVIHPQQNKGIRRSEHISGIVGTDNGDPARLLP